MNQPNILLIVSEDHGADFGCYGDRWVQTPHLDSLAEAGVRFTRAYCTQSVCSPGRASILTGLYPHQNGQIGLSTHRYGMYGALPNLPSLLKTEGYRTGLLGKLHVNPFSAFPWDLWWQDDDCISYRNRDIATTAEVGRRFMAESGSDPFLLMVAARDCHLPFLKQSFGIPRHPLKPEEVESLPFVGVDSPRLRAHTADYYNCMQRLDSLVGLLLSALKEEGKAENTVVVFVADHGAQFSRGKCSSYEGGLRIPLLLRWPGRVSGGQVCDALVSQVDILPTVLEAVGVEPPPRIAGESMLSLLNGETSSWRQHLFTEWNAAHAPLYFPQRTIRDSRYKLIRTYHSNSPSPCARINSGPTRFQPRVETGTLPGEWQATDTLYQRAYQIYECPPAEELYDLQSDPWEFRNLAGDPSLKTVQDTLGRTLDSWQKETADPIAVPALRAQLDAEHVEVNQRFYDLGDAVPEGFSWSYLNYLRAD